MGRANDEQRPASLQDALTSKPLGFLPAEMNVSADNLFLLSLSGRPRNRYFLPGGVLQKKDFPSAKRHYILVRA